MNSGRRDGHAGNQDEAWARADGAHRQGCDNSSKCDEFGHEEATIGKQWPNVPVLPRRMRRTANSRRHSRALLGRIDELVVSLAESKGRTIALVAGDPFLERVGEE